MMRLPLYPSPKVNPSDQRCNQTCILDKRSEMQSNLYFRWRDIIADFIGNTPTEMHNEFKNAFLEGRSTKELTMEQFVVFLLEIEVFSDDLGIKLPRSSDYKSAIYGN